MTNWFRCLFLASAVCWPTSVLHAQAEVTLPADSHAPLQEQLVGENLVDLARESRKLGDPVRGAIVFYQPRLACTKCHAPDDPEQRLGPDLAGYMTRPTDEHLVESVLAPSKVIRKGFESVTVVTKDGETLVGRLVRENEQELVLREVSAEGRLLTLPKQQIDERADNTSSIMPLGLVSLLGNRQEFLDLLRYLMEIAEHGPTRARLLRPSPALYAQPPLPAYEHDLDHAGLISASDSESEQRGAAIYRRVCANCHGTVDKPGTLPTAPRFASSKLKHGSDPHRMYLTLTNGFGLMVAQSWMTPRQKYDVIHYVRENFLKPHNPAQFTPVDEAYLASLPQGSSRGPEASMAEPWSAMDYGSCLAATYEICDSARHFAYKGLAIRLDAGPGGVARGRYFVVYDHDTMQLIGAWSGSGFIDWHGIMFDGQHGAHPRVVGNVLFANPSSPAWANPADGSFVDLRVRGRDDRAYGPLPNSWLHYQGLYYYGSQVVLSYTVGTTGVLESPSYEWANRLQDDASSQSSAAAPPTDESGLVVTRQLEIGPSRKELLLRVVPDSVNTALLPNEHASLEQRDGFWCLVVQPRATSLPLKLLMGVEMSVDQLQAHARTTAPAGSLTALTRGGPQRWPEILRTQPLMGQDQGPFAVDVLSQPTENPWSCQVRCTGFDFFEDGRRLAICTWDGDVWLVSGIDEPSAGLTWQRIASGLFQPLGLKIVDERVYVGCRNQIVELVDLNADGETDFYRNFNSDHQVTEHFHEFAMGLQTDDQGNFYYAKSARHALQALVPHHGTLLRVSPDGKRTDILATGFRAANGVCLNPDGTFFVTDQEGHWNPKNRINWVHDGGFYGNMWGYHDVTDTSDAAMRAPLCWITNSFDRSPSELLWVRSPHWGPLNGSLLNFSYGYGKVYVVLHETVNGQMQGGMCELPIAQFPTGVMRGRFHAPSGQLFACGMFAWAGNQTQPGGFYRVRYTGKPVHVPVELHARHGSIDITFSQDLDPASATTESFALKTWSLQRTANYGSDHFNERPLRVSDAKLLADGRTVRIELPDLQPTWCMEFRYALHAADGAPVDGVIHNTIHVLAD